MTQADKPIDDVVAELEALEAKATKGPWVTDGDQPDDVVIWATPEGNEDVFVANVGASPIAQVGVAFDADTHNAALIAAMRNALPRLLAERRELRAELSENEGVIRVWRRRATWAEAALDAIATDLPVIATCGECKYVSTSSSPRAGAYLVCAKTAQPLPMTADRRPVAPPDWCPLRKEPSRGR